MKIAYIAPVDVAHESGISKKIASQVLAWRSAGHDAKLFLMTRSSDIWSGWNRVGPAVFRYRSQLGGVLAAERLAAAARAWGLEGAYFRMGVCYPAFLRLARARPFVLEVNTDDEREANARWGSGLKASVYMGGVRAMRRRAAGAVCVSRELASRIETPSLRPLVLANGVDAARYSLRAAPCNPHPRLIFVGSAGCVWHGVDKLAHIGRCFPQWIIDVVGMERVSGPADMPPNVRFHGFLGEAEYRPLLEQADAAIGALALHRIGMNESSSLKVREYLAMGIPVILGNTDTDFESGSPFLLQLPNCEENVREQLAAIEAFVHSWRGRVVTRDDVRHLDVSEKERLRLAFLEDSFGRTHG